MWWWLSIAMAGTFPTHDTAFKSGSRAPVDAAVVIGIEDYFALPDVPHAARDAQAMRDLFVYSLGVPTDRVEVVASPASRERIEAALERAASLMGDTGTLWVYFAGHGAASPSTGERVLLGADTLADADSFEARAVPISAVEARVRGSGARTVLMVDACYSGTGRSGGELLAGKRFAVPSYATPAEASWIEWHAAKPDQLSGPLDIARHGAFTWAMAGALRGWADGQLDDVRDGTVTVEEAELYVEELLRTVGVTDQQPVLEAKDVRAVLHASERLEDRPDPAALRAMVDGFAAAPAGPVTAPTSGQPPAAVSAAQPAGPPAPTGHGTCTPFTVEEKRWWRYTGTAPHHTWVCDGGKPGWNVGWLDVIQVAPVEGQAFEELVVSQIVPYPPITRERLKAGQRSVGPGWDNYNNWRKYMKDSDVRDPATWPTLELQGPEGPVTGRWNSLLYASGNNSNHMSATLLAVVEDPRQPGSMLVCKPWSSLKAWQTDCQAALGSMLRDDRW